MLRNQKVIDISTFSLLILSLLWLKEINFLFYDSTESPDFAEYFVYFDYFANTDFKTGREHGLMYYYIQYLNYYFQYNSFSNFEMFLHKSIQEVNFWIYVYGLIGYFYFLKIYKFKNSTIFVTFVFLNFFPVSIVLRLVFKPEILAFAFLPWILYCIEKFKEKNNMLYLYILIPLLVSCITLKGNILAIICIYLLITNLNIFSRITKMHFIISLLLVTVLFLLISYENSTANEKNILDVQSGATYRENYDNKAPFSIIYKLNLYNLVTSPIKNDHADSFLGITLLETSGDYFDLYWNNDSSGYSMGSDEIIRFETSPEIEKPRYSQETNSLIIFTQKNTDLYLKSSIGLLISIIFYFFLIKKLYKNSEYRRYISAFLLGAILLLIHAMTGFPVNNFDPDVGDTFKPHYYSFLLLLSTIFFVALSLKESKKSYVYVFVYIFLMIFLLGFPKTPTQDLNQNISYFIEYSDFCNFESRVYEEMYGIEKVNCFEKELTTDLLDPDNKFFGDSILVKPINSLLILLSLISSIFIATRRRHLK